MVLTATAGAYVFKFSQENEDPFEIIYASSYFDDDVQDLTAVAIVPVISWKHGLLLNLPAPVQCVRVFAVAVMSISSAVPMHFLIPRLIGTM